MSVYRLGLSLLRLSSGLRLAKHVAQGKPRLVVKQLLRRWSFKKAGQIIRKIVK